MNKRLAWALVLVLLAALLNGCAAGDTNFTNLVASGSVTAGTSVAAGSTLTVGSKLIETKAASVTVTAAMAVQPAGTYQPVSAAGAVTATVSTTGAVAGQLVTFINTGSNAITWTEVATNVMAGDFAAGQYDALTMIFDGTRWIETARVNN